MLLPERAHGEAELWARSGAMMLTGRPNGPPLLCAGAPASAAQAALDRLAELGVAGLPDIGMLGERAAVTAGRRSGPVSVGGKFRILPAREGWVGLSLARPSDLQLLPALIESELDDEPWSTFARWLRGRTAADAGERIALLGMAGAAVPAHALARRRPGIVATAGGDRTVVDSPLVVDFTSLWAGPLCAHLLGRTGARVMKIESRSRPDAARFGAREFFDVLHEGHESVLLDFEADRELLHRLVGAADVVLESSRPRALRQLGIDADAEVERGAVWMSITAYGRGVDDEMRVGFGDDVAAGAGLVAWDDGEPLPAGDALADPLTGVTSAAAVVAALTEQQGCLLDVSMHDIASAARALSSASETDPVVLPAKARRVAHPARELGDDTARVRVEFDAWSIGRDFRSAAVLRGEWTAKGGCDA